MTNYSVAQPCTLSLMKGDDPIMNVGYVNKPQLKNRSLLKSSMLILTVFFGTSLCQTIDTIWKNQYTQGFITTNYNYILCKSNDSGFIVAGNGIIKVNRAGEMVWSKYFRETTGYFTYTNCVRTTGGYLLRFNSPGQGVQFVNDNGEIEKTFFIDYPGSYLYNYLIATPDGGYIIAGFITQHNFCRRYNNKGELLWHREILPSVGISNMTSLKNGDIVLTGLMLNIHDSLCMVRLKLYGNTVWAKTIFIKEKISSLSKGIGLNSEELLIGGASPYPEAINQSKKEQGILIKIDSLGGLVWSKLIKGIYDVVAMDTIFENKVTLLTESFTTWPLLTIDFNGIESSFKQTVNNDDFSGNSFTACNTNFFAMVNNNATIIFSGFNFPPVFTTNIKDVASEVLEDTQYRDTVTAKDMFPKDFATYYSANTNPANLQVDPNRGTIAWTPGSEADSGNHTISIIAKDRLGQADTLTYILHVTPVNDSPQIRSFNYSDNESFYEGDSIRLNVYAYDEENDSLKIIWISNEVDTIGYGVSVAFSAHYVSSGSELITCHVSDKYHSVPATRSLNVTIYKSRKQPVITSIDTTITINNVLKWTWGLSGIDTILDTNSLLFNIRIKYIGLDRKIHFFESEAIKQDSIKLDYFGLFDSVPTGQILFAVQAYDSTGYSTGYGKDQKFLFFNSGTVNTIPLIKPKKNTTISLCLKQNILHLQVPSNLPIGKTAVLSIFSPNGQLISNFKFSSFSPGIYKIPIGKSITAQTCLVVRFFSGTSYIVKTLIPGFSSLN